MMTNESSEAARSCAADMDAGGGNVVCKTCRAEVPISEAKSVEAVDYVVYFCGLDCYEEWLQGSQSKRA